MRKWRKRVLIGLGGFFGLLAVVAVGAFVYIQLTWDRTYDRDAPQLTAPTTLRP